MTVFRRGHQRRTIGYCVAPNEYILFKDENKMNAANIGCKTVHVIRDWFTEADGTSFDIARMLGFVGCCEMLYKFCVSATPDYMSFGTGFCAIIAAIAAKGFSERKSNAVDSEGK